MDGKTLSFEVPRDDLVMAYKGTLTAGTLTGTMEYRRPNRSVSSRKFTGTRATLDPLGTWRLLVQSKSRPERDHEYTIRLAREDDKLVGFYAGSDRKEVKLPEVTLSGIQLSFSVPRSDRIMAYQGTITDDFISGTMEYQREGGGSSSRTFAGTRERR